MGEINPNEVTVRLFTPEDRDMVQEFFDQMGEETVFFFNRNHRNEIRTMKYFSNEQPNHIFWAATVNKDGKELMVGLAFIWDIDKKIPWFGIAVREEYKGRHVGRLLISEVKKYVASQGGGGILLTTAQTNTRAQTLYEHCGFERFGVHLRGELLYLFRFDLD
ncbi:MAG: GNAT family N-acetyltransferase [Clostridiales bacterium]|nr:GNAT family N-acetyltransferase [Clostridiales bacterium]